MLLKDSLVHKRGTKYGIHRLLPYLCWSQGFKQQLDSPQNVPLLTAWRKLISSHCLVFSTFYSLLQLSCNKKISPPQNLLLISNAGICRHWRILKAPRELLSIVFCRHWNDRLSLSIDVAHLMKAYSGYRLTMPHIKAGLSYFLAVLSCRLVWKASYSPTLKCVHSSEHWVHLNTKRLLRKELLN